MRLFWTLHSGEPIEFSVLLERLGESAATVSPLLKAWRERGWIESYDQTLLCRPDGCDAFNNAIELIRTVEEKGLALCWLERLGATVAFVRGEPDLQQVPAGILAFSVAEVATVYEQTREGPAPRALLTEAKREEVHLSSEQERGN